MDDATPARSGDLGGQLHVVSTPIGNLGDLSSRAASVLASVDLILAEDTRRTGMLLAHLGHDRDGDGRVPMLSLHDHNEGDRSAEIVRRLLEGEAIALVSDAGTPAVSDPGHRLVRACVEAGIKVVPVPGASAVLAALVGAGLATDRFTFEGFLPRKGRSRRERLADLATERRTMVLFVSPHRAAVDLRDLASAIGQDRQGVIARELTKMHEEFIHGSLHELAVRSEDGLRGEVVVVIDGAPAPEPSDLDGDELAGEVAGRVLSGMRSKDAIAEVAAATGLPKKVVYQAVLDADADEPSTTGSSSTTT